MRKQSLVTSLFASACLLGISSAAFAETSSGSSTATITFETNLAPDILDPANPDNPYTPDPGNGENTPTGNTGPLTLDYAPNFNFGAHEILGKDTVFDSIDEKPFLQVTDRRAVLSEWKVTAKLNAFTSGGNNTLTGATLSIAQGLVSTPSYNAGATTPTTSAIELLAGGGAVDILTSTAGSPYSWLLYWPGTDVSAETDGSMWSNSYVSLSVPLNKQIKGTHVATMDWVLTDSIP